MVGFGGGGRTLVGLDIGSSSIKVVELKKTRGGIAAVHVGIEPLAIDAVVDSMIVDSGIVANAVTTIFSTSGIKSRAVATSVSGHSVIVKKITMQTVSEQVLAEQIQTEAAQHIPFAINDVNIDYQILTEDAASPQMDVLLVAVKKDKILNYTNALQLAGRQPSIVDIDAFALQNCYEYNYDPAPQTTVALLNIGASVTSISIVKGTVPLYTRDVSMGGNQYTDSLQKELDLSFEDAELLKLGNKVGTVSEDAKSPILQQVTDILVLDIQKTFEYFRATAGGERIERIYLAGGSARVAGLVETLRQEFSLPVELINPFLKIDPPSDSSFVLTDNNQSQLVVSVGLALRSFEEL